MTDPDPRREEGDLTQGARGVTGLAAIVVNYGSVALLRANLLALSRECPELLVVVVDNFTSTQEAQNVRALADEAGWHAALQPTNVGFGIGMNRGAEVAIALGAQRLLLLNPDATIDRENLELLDAVVRADPTAMVVPRILNADGSLHVAGTDVLLDTGDMRSFHKRDLTPEARHLPWITAACLVVGVPMWTTIGGFDEDYFLYWEDVDLSVRAARAGARLVVLAEATAVHDEGATHRENAQAPSRAKSNTYYYYNCRNRLVFARKNLTRADQRRWLLHSAGAGYRILLRGGRRQLLHPWGPVSAVVKGTWAGARSGGPREPSEQG